MNYIKKGVLVAIFNFLLVGCGGETKEEFYSDGGLKYSAKYNSDSKLDGEYRSFYRNGKPKEKKEYSEGLLDGEYISYYINGKIEFVKHYEKDVRTGETKLYYKSGKLKEIATHIDGNINGKYIVYWENGNIGLEEEYNMGKRHGVFKVLSESGELIQQSKYSNGLLEGKYIYYRKNEESIVAIFEKGNLKSGYGYPIIMTEGWGFRRTTYKKGNKVILTNNNDFINLMIKNEYSNMFEKIPGLAENKR